MRMDRSGTILIFFSPGPMSMLATFETSTRFGQLLLISLSATMRQLNSDSVTQKDPVVIDNHSFFRSSPRFEFLTRQNWST